MTPERYEQIERLCHQVMERPAPERAAFLQVACAGDEGLRREVESLLPALEQSGSFLETPPADIAAQMLKSEQSQASPAPRRRLAHYQLRSLLGKGGMGEVYLAEDPRLGRLVAIKVLAPHMLRDETAKARFLREARAASQLDHPNIGTVHDVGEQDGELFMVMALYEGQTLKQRLEKDPLPVAEAVGIIRQVAQGLEAAHRVGIVHRDIKPANVLVTSSGVVKILDFGLAKLVSDSQGQTTTQAGLVMGTPLYMSPEQLRGESVDGRSDLWSLGALAYELLSGVSPFQSISAQGTVSRILNDESASLARFPGMPSRLAELVSQLLQKAPSRRPQNASEVLERLENVQGWFSSLKRWHKTAVVFSMVVFLGIVAVSAGLFYRRYARIHWGREQALPEIQRLVDQQQYIAAFELARKAEQYLLSDPQLVKLKNQFLFSSKIRSEPAGADVSFKPYENVQGHWFHVGRTPIENARLPLGYFRWRITKLGYETVDSAFPIPAAPEIKFTLKATGSIPAGMVYVPGGTSDVAGNPDVKVDDFVIDKYEVTNREYKKFLDARGYRDPKYWKHLFIKDGQTLGFEQAMALFRDKTDRSGPSTWELANYPQGQDDYPVGGLSWYEAAAYAEFVGKSLPTVYHWYRAAHGIGIPRGPNFSDVLQVSNFSGKGPAPVGSYPGLGAYGTYDMAGNLKEWVINATGDRRYILGGAWSDPVYMYQYPDARSAFDRSPTNGIRLVKDLNPGPMPEVLIAPVDQLIVDYRIATPVPDAVFNFYQSLYAYDRTPLDAKIEAEDDSSPYWRKQRITFNAAYDDERVIAYLFLPKNASPPFQTVIHFPHGGALQFQSISDADLVLTDFLIKSGRALMFPIYKGTYERFGQPLSIGTIALRDRAIKQATDFRRSIDYLETRPDIDPNRFGYYGISWGSSKGPILLAIEHRIKVAVLYAGGCFQQRGLPELDSVNFAPRVKVPVLMINGRYDFIMPLKTCQEPIFRLLGTPAADKRHALFESGHSVPLTPAFKETLNWLDHYLGPVR